MADIKIAVLLLVLIVGTQAWLTVHSPMTLKKQFGDRGKIQTNYANFGVIPYGRSYMGNLYFDKENADGCEPFTNNLKHNDTHEGTKFFIVKRGKCKFVQKVRNIEHAGGALGVIADNTEEVLSSIIMVDDGTGLGISIPSLIISKQDGANLIDFYTNSEKVSDEGPHISMNMKFEMKHPDNRVEYDIWLTSTDDHILDFI